MTITNNIKIAPILILFVLICYLSILFFPAFTNEGALLQTDQPTWTALAEIVHKEIFPQQKWFWGVTTDRVGAGLEIGRSYSMSIIVPQLFMLVTDSAHAIKYTMVLSFVFFIIAFYFLARFFMKDTYALICSFVLITPMFDNMVSGMWYNYFSLACGIIFWICCLIFRQIPGKITYVLLALFFAMSIYSHPIGLIFCLLIWSSFLILYFISPEGRNIRTILIFLSIPIVGILLAFPQIETIIGLDLRHMPTSSSLVNYIELTSITEIFRRMLFIRVWGAIEYTTINIAIMAINISTILALSAMGIYSLYSKKAFNQLIPIIILIMGTLILISRFASNVFGGSGALGELADFYDRFQLFSQIYLVLLSGIGIQYGYETYWNIWGFKNKGIIIKVLLVIFLINLIYIGFRTPQKIFIDKTDQLGTLDTSIVHNDFIALCNWLKTNVHPNNERVYFEDTYKSLHWCNSDNPEAYKTHIFALVAAYTNINMINGFCGYTSPFAKYHECGEGKCIFGKSINNIVQIKTVMRNEMKLLNCKYLVVHSPEVSKRIEEIDFLKQVATFNKFNIYENKDITPAWAFRLNTGEAIKKEKISETHFRILCSGIRNDPILISYAYNPKWQAFANRTPVQIGNYQNLMKIVLPTQGTNIIDFYYPISKSRSLIMILCGTILMITIGLFL